MDTIGIYWIPLRTNLIPFLEREVDQVVEKFFGKIKRFERQSIERKSISIKKFWVTENFNQCKNRRLRSIF